MMIIMGAEEGLKFCFLFSKKLIVWFVFPVQIVTLKVVIHCEGCRRKIKRIIYGLDGNLALTETVVKFWNGFRTPWILGL